MKNLFAREQKHRFFYLFKYHSLSSLIFLNGGSKNNKKNLSANNNDKRQGNIFCNTSRLYIMFMAKCLKERQCRVYGDQQTKIR